MAYLYNTGKHLACFTDQNRIKLDKLKVVYQKAYGRKFNKVTAFLNKALTKARVEKTAYGTQINVSAPKNFNIILTKEIDACTLQLSLGAKVNKNFGGLAKAKKRVA